MGSRLRLDLTDGEFDGLVAIAQADMRLPSDQAHYLIRREIVARGLLTAAQFSERAPRPRKAQTTKASPREEDGAAMGHILTALEFIFSLPPSIATREGAAYDTRCGRIAQLIAEQGGPALSPRNIGEICRRFGLKTRRADWGNRARCIETTLEDVAHRRAVGQRAGGD